MQVWCYVRVNGVDMFETFAADNTESQHILRSDERELHL